MKQSLAIAGCAVAAVVLSACGSSRPIATPVAAHYHGAASLTFVANAPSTGLGIENSDLYSATPGGSVRDLTGTAAAESSAAWSADGHHVVFIREWTTARPDGQIVAHNGVFAWSPGHGAPHKIGACGRYCSPQDFAWSPDDSRIAYTGPHGGIEVMNADGSNRHVICGANQCGGIVEGPAWSPDGRRLVFSNPPYGFGPVDPPGAIWIANADGSGVHKLTQSTCDLLHWPKGSGCAIDASPAWSPSGSLIAFSRRPVRFQRRSGERIGATELEVMRADGSHLRTLATCDGAFCLQDLQPTWSPTGKALAWVKVSRGDAVLQLTTLAGRTSPLRTCGGPRCVYPDEPIWSPDGRQLAFFSGGVDRTIWTMRSDGRDLRRIAGGADSCCLEWIARAALPGRTPKKTSSGTFPRLSGAMIFDTADSSTPSSRPYSLINLMKLSTGRVQQIRVASSLAVQPSWSPNGQRIAFGGIRKGNTNIFVAHRDGTDVRVLTHFRGGATEPAWSPDGREIAFETDNDVDLVRLGDVAHPRRVTAGSDPSWAPSGHKLVFGRHLGGESEALFTIRPDGTGLTRLTNLPGEQRSPVWSPDGSEIAFDWATPGGLSLYLIRPDGTHLRRVTTQAVPDGRAAWSPDGRYLVLLSDTSPKSTIDLINVKTGRLTTIRTIFDYAADPSWWTP